jgi:hypothetical protein
LKNINLKIIFFYLSLFLIINSCSRNIPEGYKKFIGLWRNDSGISLSLKENGKISYTRKNKSDYLFKTSGLLNNFEKNKIVYSVFFIKEIITIIKEPYIEGDQTKIIIDNNELIKINDTGNEWSIINH